MAASTAIGSLALEFSGFATATVATLATVTLFSGSGVATVAGVAVATAPNYKKPIMQCHNYILPL